MEAEIILINCLTCVSVPAPLA